MMDMTTTSTGMMDMTTMSTGMMIGMGIACVILIVFVLLGIAALIKYLRT
jgi:hypothetical protein